MLTPPTVLAELGPVPLYSVIAIADIFMLPDNQPQDNGAGVSF